MPKAPLWEDQFHTTPTPDRQAETVVPESRQPVTATRRRGFAAMDPALRSAIASKGGKRAHELGVAHEWGKGEEATTAGKKGAAARKASR